MQPTYQRIDLPTLDQVIDLAPLTVASDTSVAEAIALLSQAQASCVLVVKELQLVGIFTKRDVVKLVTAGMDLSRIKIAYVMTRQVITLTQSNSQNVFTALLLMRQHQIRHLPIVDKHGQLVGLVTQSGLLQVFEPTAIASVIEALQQQVEARTTELQQEIAQRQQIEPDLCQAQTHLEIRDITLQNQAQAAQLRESEGKFEAVFNSALDAIVILDDYGRCINANSSAYKLSGVSKAELLGSCIADFIEPSFDFSATLQSFRQQKQLAGELRLYQRNGTMREVEYTVTADFLPHLHLSIFRDITARKQAEDKLRRSEEQLRLALEFSHIGSWDWHITTGKVTWNDNHFRLLGLVPSEVEVNYQTWRDRVHPEDIERVEQTIADGLETHNDFASEYRIIYPDGSLRWLLDKGRATYDQSGQPVRAIGIIIDLTERKLAEAALQQSEEKFRLLAENMRAAVWIATPDASQNFYISPAYEQIWGRSCQSLQEEPLSWLDAVHPEDRSLIMNRLEQRQLRSEHSNVEYRILQPDGTIRWVWDRSFPIRNQRGEIYYAGIAEDITARKQIEQKIFEQAMLLDVATDAILVRGLDNQILFWNKSAERLYGWSSEEALGKNASELLFQEITPQLQEALKTVFESSSWQGELCQVDKFGKEIIATCRWTLVRDRDGQPKSILIVNTDITQKKKIEAQLLRTQRLESIGTLAGGIAHDLNNVLAPILMSVQLLQLKYPENQNQPLLKILEENVKRGAALVKQVLSFARGLEGDRTIVQVRHIILEIAQIVKETFPKSIEFSTDIAPDLWTVSADITQLHQVLMNFCVNARDAMPNGGTLNIAAANVLIDESYVQMNIEAKVGPHVVITVTDTGTGIPPEIIERIFDPFFTTKEVGKGTGLGLSTVLGIVRSHGGFVKVYSEVGKGSRFNVYLPAEEKIATQPAAADPELLTGDGELILVVDDEAPICDITKTTLESHKYQVLTANDGIEGLALYAQYKHDICLVLIDMMMPKMDGMIAIPTLKRMNPQVQIVAMSGMASSEAIAQATSAGVQGFLSKPFTAKELLNTLQKVLS